MGNSTSKSKTQPGEGKEFQFSEEENDRLETVFKPLLIITDNKKETLDRTKLKEMLNSILSDKISDRLCEIIAELSSQSKNHNKPSEELVWNGLLAIIGKFLKCSYMEQCRILMKIATNHRTKGYETVTTKEMIEFVSDFSEAYFVATNRTKEFVSWKNGIESTETEKLSKFLLYELFFRSGSSKENLDKEIPDKDFNLEDVEEWFSRTSLAARIIEKVFRASFRMDKSQEDDSLLPICNGVNWTKVKTIMTYSDILVLNQHLPTSSNKKWRYLFSSLQYGESFSQLLGKIINRGPTLIVVRDKEGNVFGGFASHSWQIQSKFYGSDESFLFNLKPQIGIYPSTGYNSHFMYLNVNQQTMPNGIGMGGQLEYFGLYISDNYGKGTCSKSCTTYQSPQLSSSTEFDIDTIEVWGVGSEPEPEPNTRRSALDTMDPELKAILEMVGKTPISEDIRKADAKIEEISE